MTHALLTNPKANITCPLVAIHHRFLSLFPIFISLSVPSSLVSYFSYQLFSPIMTWLASHYSLFPHSLSPISFPLHPLACDVLRFSVDMLFFCCILLSICRARSYDVFSRAGFLCFFHVPLTPLHVLIHRPFTLSDALFSMYIVHHDHYSNELQRFFFTLPLKSLS
jgi:hypothetical protein